MKMKKKLKFRSNLVPKILSGQKTATWRINDEKNIQVGDYLTFINSETGEQFAEAVAEDVYEKSFDGLSEEDRQGHERYKDDAEMLEVFSEYYGKNIQGDHILKIIRYRLRGTE